MRTILKKTFKQGVYFLGLVGVALLVFLGFSKPYTSHTSDEPVDLFIERVHADSVGGGGGSGKTGGGDGFEGDDNGDGGL